MTIYTGSRYEFSTVDFFSVKAGGDENPTVFYQFPDIGLVTYYEHTVVEGERIDEIAYRYYQRPGLWWLILDYNPEIATPFDLTPGMIIRIPRV